MAQVEGESKAAPEGAKAAGRPRLSSTGHVYAGLSDEEVEVRPRSHADAPCAVLWQCSEDNPAEPCMHMSAP